MRRAGSTAAAGAGRRWAYRQPAGLGPSCLPLLPSARPLCGGSMRIPMGLDMGSLCGTLFLPPPLPAAPDPTSSSKGPYGFERQALETAL